MSGLSHVGAGGLPRMVDISDKTSGARRAVVTGELLLQPEHFAALSELPKGEPLEVAHIAGVLAAKKTGELIPLCHNVPLTWAHITFTVAPTNITITTEVKSDSSTGVEMEAYVATVIAGVTLIDMLKSVGPDLVLTNVRLMEKEGGKAPWKRM